MKIFGPPRLSIFKQVVLWLICIFVVFPICVALTLLSCGMIRGMDIFDAFADWILYSVN